MVYRWFTGRSGWLIWILLLVGCGGSGSGGSSGSGSSGATGPSDGNSQGGGSTNPVIGGVGRIAFIREVQPGGPFHLFVVNPDGRNEVSLIDQADLANYTGPTWSPDGTQVAFASNVAEKGNYDILVIHIDGSNRRRVSTSPSGDFAPAWSPDGQTLVYQSWRNNDTAWDIYSIKVDGTEEKNLTNFPGNDQLPTWSPDGLKITFQSGTNRGTDIFVMDADGSNRTRLTEGTGAQFSAPAWSLDGAQIAFESTRHQPVPLPGQEPIALFEIYVMGADGKNIRRLTTTASLVEAFRNPSWSPDGKQIVFEAQRRESQLGTGLFGLMVIGADGTNQFEIPNLGAFGGRFPRRSPVP